MRARIKRAAFSSGALGRYHRLRNRRTLTVVTFHRVLAEADERWATADPRYTVTSAFLRDCLGFFRSHYEPVDGPTVAAAARGEAGLSPHALLVTFDDGWADTADCALPVLRQLGCPAVVFVPPTVVGRRQPFWQERVFAAWRLGLVGDGELERAGSSAGDAPFPPREESTVRELIARLGTAEAPARDALVERLAAGLPAGRPEMVSLEQLHELRDEGVEIGAHGLSHEPLAGLPTAAVELRESRAQLAELLGRPVGSMSFPHGSYDPPALAAAREEYEVVYTSDAGLNALVGGRLASPVVGRIGIPGRELSDARGRLRPELLALWLFRRPHTA